MAITLNGTTGITTPGLSADSPTLTVDSANNRVGIGITEPNVALHILSTTTGFRVQRDINSLAINPNYGGQNHCAVEITNSLSIFTGGGSEKLRIDSTGNVGIGVTNPQAVIHAYHPTSNTICTLESGDAGAVINLLDPSQRSSIEQNGVSLKITSDSDATFANSDIRLQVDGATRMRVQSTGNVAIDNGNLVFSTSGTGINFSATSDGSGTTTSELLNDYEEGIWTPQVTQGVSGTPTYTNQLGWYTKIGRIVTLYFYIRFGTTGNTGSNSIFHVGNFPFPVASSNNTVLMRGMGVSNYHSIPGFTSANVSFYGAGNSNTFASLYQGQNPVATSSAVNSAYIIGGIEYISE